MEVIPMKYVSDHTKAPILLSKEHRLSTLVILYCHLKVMHREVKQTLNEIRSNYWITRGRYFVKKVISPCVICKTLNCRPYNYPGHSDLPELRFDDLYPFASTWCDYLGPLYVLPVYEKKIIQGIHGPIHVVLQLDQYSLVPNKRGAGINF